jgi:hypothetical protein
MNHFPFFILFLEKALPFSARKKNVFLGEGCARPIKNRYFQMGFKGAAKRPIPKTFISEKRN